MSAYISVGNLVGVTTLFTNHKLFLCSFLNNNRTPSMASLSLAFAHELNSVNFQLYIRIYVSGMQKMSLSLDICLNSLYDT